MKYQPEDKAAKADRLKAIAEGGKKDDKAPHVIKFGLKHVTYLIESKKAKLVCIASDVDPVELVVWLPALCKKMDVPYCIVKDKSRLGTVTRQKTCAAVAFTSVRKEDQHSLDQLKSTFKAMYNDVTRHPWGGGIMGLKTQRKLEARRALARRSSRSGRRVRGGGRVRWVRLIVFAAVASGTDDIRRRFTTDEGSLRLCRRACRNGC